jgi:hypothetical protein
MTNKTNNILLEQTTTMTLQRYGKVLKIPSQKTCLLHHKHFASGEKQR